MRLGDTVRFDVLGRTVEARVTSVRAVDWDDSRSGGFMFLFRPGAFDGAPHTYISFLRGPAEPTRAGRCSARSSTAIRTSRSSTASRSSGRFAACSTT